MSFPAMHKTQIGVRLRGAAAPDYEFAQSVHHAGMRWLGERLHGEWDQTVQNARFEQKFVLEEVRVIVVDGEDVGYVQTAVETEDISIKELHIGETFQNRCIGTEVLRMLRAEAQRIAKPMTVSVVKFNPALAFYERAGFQVMSEKDQRVLLRHEIQ
jgi:ribosomal protein S18 acetylase RimI-like enzyme